MNLISLSAATLVAALAVMTAASAQVVGPLPAPPAAGGAASSAIFDALMAIERATAANAGGAQTASLTYNAAIQQYNAGDYARSLASAQTAIMQTAIPPLPQPSLAPPPIPQPTYYEMHNLHSSDQADAESFVGLARRSLTACGAPTAPAPAAVTTQYAQAVAALSSHNYNAAKAGSQAVINQCAFATQAYAAQQATLVQPSPTPMQMAAYSPIPVATLIPDPALLQAPAIMPTATPSPAPEHHHFLF